MSWHKVIDQYKVFFVTLLSVLGIEGLTLADIDLAASIVIRILIGLLTSIYLIKKIVNYGKTKSDN